MFNTAYNNNKKEDTAKWTEGHSHPIILTAVKFQFIKFRWTTNWLGYRRLVPITFKMLDYSDTPTTPNNPKNPKKAIFPFLKNIRYSNNIKEFVDNEYSLDKLNQGKFKAALLMENHDHIRSVSRFGGSINPDYIDDTGDESVHRLAWTVDKVGREKHQKQAYFIKSRAKALALFKFLQQGIPVIYNGEEIGMDNDYTGSRHDITRKENRYIELSYDLQSRYWLGLKEVRKDYVSFFYRTLGRESARTVFQWRGQEKDKPTNAGFCSDSDENCKLWNGVNEPTREDAEANYRKLLYLRKTNSTLNHGSFKALEEGRDFKTLSVNNLSSKMVTAYTRSTWFKKYLVIANLDYQSQLVKINLGKYLTLDRLLLNTHHGINYQNNLLELQPYQGIVVKVYPGSGGYSTTNRFFSGCYYSLPLGYI